MLVLAVEHNSSTVLGLIILTVYFVIDKVIDIFQYLHCMAFHHLHLF